MVDLIQENLILKIHLPERLKRVWKHPQAVLIKFCLNHYPRGKEGLTMGVEFLPRNK